VSTLVAIAFALGIVLSVVERFASATLKKFIPSASGLGISMVLPASMSATMALGALAGYVVRRRRKNAETGLVPAASGAIAGESLMGVLLAILSALGITGK